jgi:hypothetical protein
MNERTIHVWKKIVNSELIPAPSHRRVFSFFGDIPFNAVRDEKRDML